MRLAAIDIGSNAARLLITDVISGPQGVPEFIKTALVRVPLRLGFDVFDKGEISAIKMEKILKTIKSYKLLLDVYEVRHLKACATSAMRDASNAPEIIKKVKAETGIEIQIISGDSEASLIYENHVAESMTRDESYLYVDVGGGSTELTLFAKNKLVDSRSFNLGAVRYLKGIVKKEDEKELKKWVKKTTAKHKPLYLIGSGGNINKIFKLSGTKASKNASLTIGQVTQVYKLIKSYSLEERVKNLDMNPDRADVIIPASEIFIDIMKGCGSSKIYVPKIGLADGIIRQLYREYKEKTK